MQITHPDGGSVYAYTGGKPWPAGASGGPVRCAVFLHGALNDHSVWTLPARWFAHHGWAVLAPDLPGHGRSAGPALPDVESLADWLLALLHEAGVGGAAEVALIGHSMGSLIALEAAARALDTAAALRVSRLVLVGTAVPMPVSDLLLDTARATPQRAIDLVVAYAHSTLAAKPGNPGPGTWHHGASRRLMQQVLARAEAGRAGSDAAGSINADGGASGRTDGGANLFHHDFSLCNAYAGGLAAATRVAAAGATRCHVVVGERDRMTAPRAARSVIDALGAQRHGLPGAGHELMQEDPEGLLRALRTALAG